MAEVCDSGRWQWQLHVAVVGGSGRRQREVAVAVGAVVGGSGRWQWEVGGARREPGGEDRGGHASVCCSRPLVRRVTCPIIRKPGKGNRRLSKTGPACEQSCSHY